MLEMDNRQEVDLGGVSREVPASRFWSECSRVSCRARGPVSGQRPTSNVQHPTSKDCTQASVVDPDDDDPDPFPGGALPLNVIPLFVPLREVAA